jgi:PEP-CTERM motif
MRKAWSLVLGLTSAAMLSHASLTPFLQGVGAGDSAGTFKYFYDVTLDTGQQIDENNQPSLVFYDFYGYVAGTLAVTGPGAAVWTASDSEMVSAPPSGTLPLGTSDSPAAVNFRFTYTGALPSTGAAIEGVGDVVLSFTADSIYNQVRLTPFSSLASKDNDPGIDEGTGYGAQGQAEAPTSAVPEPATMSLLGGSLLVLAGIQRRFKNR